MIQCIRIDFRLVHGQIIHSWLKSTNSNIICILDDALVFDQYRIKMLKICIPPHIKLEIHSIQKGIHHLEQKENDKTSRYLVLLKDIIPCITVCQALHITTFNIGETIYSPDKKRIANSVYVTEQEVIQMNDFLEKMNTIEVRQVYESRKQVYTYKKKIT